MSLREHGVGSVLWCIGFRPDFGWLDAPVFDAQGNPQHQRGVTAQPGLYFIGLPWLHAWGSGRFSAVSADAAHLAEQIQSTVLSPETASPCTPLMPAINPRLAPRRNAAA